MKISRQFDERLFKQIADTTGNKQIKKDISVCLRWYFENGYYHAYVECIDESAFIIAYKNAKSLRVYGICTAKEKQGGWNGKLPSAKGLCVLQRKQHPKNNDTYI